MKEEGKKRTRRERERGKNALPCLPRKEMKTFRSPLLLSFGPARGPRSLSSSLVPALFPLRGTVELSRGGTASERERGEAETAMLLC